MDKSGSKRTGIHVGKENVVQAVVITDIFNDNFCPVTSSSAQCLMPLVNRPLLDYTLECLSFSRVKEVILFCSAFAEQIKDFTMSRKWGRMKVNVIVSEGCRSLGDAMRDLDAKSILRGDFILLTGNVIGNLKILSALDAHKKNVLADKGAVMTLVYKECGKRLKSIDDNFCVVVDSHNNRVLCCNRFYREKKLNLPLDMILETSDVDIRCDLLNTGVCICSVSVPPLFSDNFDIQTLDDFVRSLLINDEIMESTVYCYILPKQEYAARITNWQNYHSISHDVLHRWSFPHVPDICDNYSYRIHNIYKQEGVSLAQGCSIVEDVAIGEGTVIGKDAKISTSIIGNGCKIFQDTCIKSSHLFINVTIEEKCNVEYCVLGEGCFIKKGAKLYNSVLGPGVVVEPESSVINMRLQLSPSRKEVGLGDKAFAYERYNDFESDSESSEEDEDKEPSWGGLRLDPPPSETEESSDSEAEISDRESIHQEDTNLFYNEVVDSLVRGYEDKISCNNLVLEVNSSRYAYNVTVNEVNYYVMRAILSFKQVQDDKDWQSLQDCLHYFLPLLVNYIRNDTARMDCLTAIEDEAENKARIKFFAVKILHYLYEKDILNEDSILEWYRSPREESPFSKHLRIQMSSFIKWLEEADEESSSDES